MTSSNTETLPTTSVKKPQKQKSRRRRSRELALQGIYQWRVTGGDLDFIETQLRETNEFPKTDKKYFIKLLHGVLQDVEALAAQIQPLLDRPSKEISPVEFAILLISTYELTNFLEIPYRIVINEAIELAKSFGGTDGHKYVNGILDKQAAQLRTVEISVKTKG